jgi:uroporphyrin-III C-methyltransferase
VRAVKVIGQADVVVHDGLVSQAIVDLAPADARRICVAKRKSRHSYPQDEINRMLAAFALDGLTVVRLKGGDPFVFGRGGDELEACRAAGVECHVVPGVTAALAAGAAAGAPLTHRGAAQAVVFVTGHAKAGETPDLDWAALARALIVENASLEGERRVATTLGSLEAATAGLSGPAILIVGEAMALARATPVAPVSISIRLAAGGASR